MSAIDIDAGTVFEAEGVKVTAFEVDHGDRVKPAFGYRIDYAGRSAVVSGDTRFNENLIRHATGTDLLIHQVAAVRPARFAMTVPEVIELTRKTYGGPLLAGEDLMVFRIGREGVRQRAISKRDHGLAIESLALLERCNQRRRVCERNGAHDGNAQCARGCEIDHGLQVLRLRAGDQKLA